MTDSGELKPCRACSAPCRVERFEGGPIEGVMTVYMCANSTKFGGDCPDPHAYLNINAWNDQPKSVSQEDGWRDALVKCRGWLVSLSAKAVLDREPVIEDKIDSWIEQIDSALGTPSPMEGGR